MIENERLARYAKAANHEVYVNQSDLDPKVRAMPGMLAWCRRHGNIVVLNDSMILTCEPGSRVVQNCKAVMLNEGLSPGLVRAASSSLVSVLLANANETDLLVDESDVESVSTQQQRLRMLVKEAVNVGASDIHIEVRPQVARIRFRKHGELYLHAEWLPKLGREIASVAFNKETDHAITHFNPTIPQSASMPLRIDGTNVRLRLASLPAHGGFDVVMRILATADEDVVTLAELGYQRQHIDLIKKAVGLPNGAVIVAGPTGSGKTTTLASCVQLIGPDRKLYTIEDPVEKVVPNATQVPVNTDHYDRSFASMGRTALRMDPDVMVLGEMRDEETAAVMVRAAITGHLIFSTLHTNTATGIVTRLIDMDISPKLLGDPSVLACLICQRLVPTLCESCAVPVTDSPEHQAHLARWREMLGEDLSQVRGRGHHCRECHGLGIAGRTVIAEIIWIDELSRGFIKERDMLGWRKHLSDHGWITQREQAIERVLSGVCDPLDAEKLVGEISAHTSAESFDYRQC